MHNWNPFNHLLMKVRGDGRNYLLTLAFDYEFDVMWGSQHHYRLFTRGGPYWQIAKVMQFTRCCPALSIKCFVWSCGMSYLR